MSETSGIPVGHEAYAFACMRCGHGWEQAYDIEHHTDIAGRDFVVYRSGGRRVPSPLSKPTCPNCERHVVRIMGPGRISVALGAALGGAAPAAAGPEPQGGPPRAGGVVAGAEAGRSGATRAGGPEPRRRHLLRPFRRG